MVHRLLKRQLRRTSIMFEDQEVEDLLGDLGPLLEDPSLPEAARRLCRGFGQFLERVEGTYLQHDRDQELRTRSLHLSSEELIQANERLQAVAESQARIVLSLRTAANELLSSQGKEEIGTETNDLARLSSLMADLLADRRKALLELEQQKLALDEHAIVTATDTEGVILYANDKFCEISGYDRSELIGSNHRIINSGLHPPEFFRVLWDTIKAGRVWHGEICNRAKSGDLYWLAATIVPIRGESGRPSSFIAIRTDITERKTVELELQVSKAQYDELTTRIPVGVFTLTIDVGGLLTFDYVSDRFCQLLGLERVDVMRDASAVFSLVPAEEAAGLQEAIRRVTQTLGPFLWEGRAWVDGERRWFHIESAATAIPGRGSRWNGILVDVTERKEAELSIRGARDLAVAASKAKSDFLANMSHEIRTPMNGVLGMLGLLRETTLDEEQLHFTELAQLSGRNLLSLINDILDLSKVEAGRLELEDEDFDLKILLEEVSLTMAPRAQQKGIQFLQSMDPATPQQLRGDARRLQQVLVNLADNALKFTAAGQVRIQVRALFATTSEVTLRFSVRDTGIGIPKHKLGSLFQSFSQVDASTTRRFGGTGLGLAISRQLAGLLGGEIGVNSEEGKGSEFWFTARLGRREQTLEALAPPFDGPAVLRQDFQRGRILLAEDNNVNQELALAILEQWNLEVEVASDGLEAIQALKRSDFDLVLMDIQMPKLDGLEATASLRNPLSGVRNPKIIVVALTAHAMSEDRQLCLDAGMNDYLVKPLEPAALLAILNRYLPAEGSGPQVDPATVAQGASS